MTGRDLIFFILKNHLEDHNIVFEKTNGGGAWHHITKSNFDIGGGILIIKHPEVKREKKTKLCRWKMDDDGIWQTKCENSFIICNEGTPEENNMEYCPYCGYKIYC